MTNVTKLALLGMGVPMAAGSAYLIYHMSKLETFLSKLTSDGKTAIAPGEAQKWKSKFIDFGSIIASKVKPTGYTSGGDVSDTHIAKLKDWCGKESEKSSTGDGYETYSQLCSTDIKTVRAKLISEGLEIPSGDNDWKLIFLNNKHESDFLTKVNGAQTPASSLSSSSKASEAHDKVSQYCYTLLNVAPTGENKALASKWCVKSTVDKVEAKLLSLGGFTKPGEGDYEKMVNKWNTNESFKTTALRSQNSGTDQDKDKLKKYCEGEFTKTLISLDDSYETTMKNIYNFCNGTLPNGADLREVPWQS